MSTFYISVPQKVILHTSKSLIGLHYMGLMQSICAECSLIKTYFSLDTCASSPFFTAKQSLYVQNTSNLSHLRNLSFICLNILFGLYWYRRRSNALIDHLLVSFCNQYFVVNNFSFLKSSVSSHGVEWKYIKFNCLVLGHRLS